MMEFEYTFPRIMTHVIQNDWWVGIYATARVTSAREAVQCKKS